MTLTTEQELALIHGGQGPQPAPMAAPPEQPTPEQPTPAQPIPAPPAPEQPAAPADRFAQKLVPPETGLPELEDHRPAGWGTVFSAAWQSDTIAQDINDNAKSRRDDLAYKMLRLLPPDARQRIFARYEDPENDTQTLPDLVVAEAVQSAGNSPIEAQKWAGFPLSRQDFDRRINADRLRDYQEAEAVLDRDGGWVPAIAGHLARGMTDGTNLMLLPFGAGGGSVLRTIASEAALGAFGAAMTLPAEERAATDLGLPAPDPTQEILIGAAFGGGLAAAGHGLAAGIMHGPAWIKRAKGWTDARITSLRAAKPDGTALHDFELDVDSAEARLTGNPTVQEQLAGEKSEPGTLPAILRQSSGGGVVSFDYRANGNASPKTNRVGYVYGKLLDLGYPPHVAAGLVGNLMQEGSPSLNTATIGDNGNAFGMAQWNGPRRKAYLSYAARKGVDPADLNTQIEFLHRELQGPERAALDQIMAAPDARTAALVASQKFWRPGVPMNEYRIAYAEAVARQYAEGQVPKWQGASMLPDLPSYSPMPTQRGYTGEGQVTAGDRFRVNVRYEVVDLASLQKATGAFQPRDRSRVASDAWIADTAARLDPVQLMPAPTADRGTPIVGPDHMIESGNGRVAAISRAYDQFPDRATAYRAQIEAAGFKVPDGMDRPVLIARRTSEFASDAERVDFTVAGQDSGVAAMTPTEVAATSSRAMTAPVLAQLDPSQPLTDAGNGGFVRAVLAGLPRSVRNGMFDAAGLLNASGTRQLREALFARAWPDPGILARFTEGNAAELKSLMDALDRSAPQWAALRADIEAGRVDPAMDIGGYVLDAMRLIGAARDLSTKQNMPIGKAVMELLNEVDLLDGPVAPLTAAMVHKFWRDGRAAPADEIAAFLTRYAEDARKAGAAQALFDAPGPRDVLVAIDPKTFGDLPADLGSVRGFATPTAKTPQMQTADAALAEFDAGAASPAATEADATIRDTLMPPDAPTKSAAPAQPSPAHLDVESAKARAEVAAAGQAFLQTTVQLEDGTRAKASKILADADADAGFDAVIQACAIAT